MMPEDARYEVLREAWQITERKNNAVYKTKSLGEVWIPMGRERDPDNTDIIYSSLSTKRLDELISQGVNTIRRKKA